MKMHNSFQIALGIGLVLVFAPLAGAAEMAPAAAADKIQAQSPPASGDKAANPAAMDARTADATASAEIAANSAALKETAQGSVPTSGKTQDEAGSTGKAAGPAAMKEKADETAGMKEKTREATANSSSQPPKHLKKLADGHWTAWDPPAPPAGTTTHTVAAGETFWGLAEQNLKNPYLWPQIWDQNRYVSDSHWIYPGDPIVMPSPEVVPTTGSPNMSWSPSEPAKEQPAPAVAKAPPAPPPPPREYPIGDEQDLYCASHIVDGGPPRDPHIVATEDEKLIGIAQGHIVYINAGSNAGFRAGERFTVVRDRGKVKHPVTHDLLGERVDGIGALSILAVQKTSATAEIIFSCQDLLRGDRVVPLQEYTVPTRTTVLSEKIDRYNTVPSGKPSGYLVVSKDPQHAVGQGHIVNVTLGESEVKPGDILTIFRPNPSGEDLPRLNVGEGVVLLIDGRSSVVKITASVREMYVGDNVEVR